MRHSVSFTPKFTDTSTYISFEPEITKPQAQSPKLKTPAESFQLIQKIIIVDLAFHLFSVIWAVNFLLHDIIQTSIFSLKSFQILSIVIFNLMMIIYGTRILLKKRKIFYMKTFRVELNYYRILRYLYHIAVVFYVVNDWIQASEDPVGVCWGQVLPVGAGAMSLGFCALDCFIAKSKREVMRWMDNRNDLTEWASTDKNNFLVGENFNRKYVVDISAILDSPNPHNILDNRNYAEFLV
jgi:hypothetical protein